MSQKCLLNIFMIFTDRTHQGLVIRRRASHKSRKCCCYDKFHRPPLPSSSVRPQSEMVGVLKLQIPTSLSAFFHDRHPCGGVADFRQSRFFCSQCLPASLHSVAEGFERNRPSVDFVAGKGIINPIGRKSAGRLAFQITTPPPISECVKVIPDSLSPDEKH